MVRIIAHPLPHATIAVDAYRGVRHMPGLGVQLANGIDEQQRLVQRIHMAHIGDELGLLLHQCVMRRPVGRVKNGFSSVMFHSFTTFLSAPIE